MHACDRCARRGGMLGLGVRLLAMFASLPLALGACAPGDDLSAQDAPALQAKVDDPDTPAALGKSGGQHHHAELTLTDEHFLTAVDPAVAALADLPVQPFRSVYYRAQIDNTGDHESHPADYVVKVVAAGGDRDASVIAQKVVRDGVAVIAAGESGTIDGYVEVPACLASGPYTIWIEVEPHHGHGQRWSRKPHDNDAARRDAVLGPVRDTSCGVDSSNVFPIGKILAAGLRTMFFDEMGGSFTNTQNGAAPSGPDFVTTVSKYGQGAYSIGSWTWATTSDGRLLVKAFDTSKGPRAVQVTTCAPSPGDNPATGSTPLPWTGVVGDTSTALACVLTTTVYQTPGGEPPPPPSWEVVYWLVRPSPQAGFVRVCIETAALSPTNAVGSYCITGDAAGNIRSDIYPWSP